MNDEQIIELYWARDEKAISETNAKYGRYCGSIAYNILHNAEDVEECVNDTYLRAWNAIPPARPNRLSTFLGKITRNLSFNRYQKYNAEKRGGRQVELALSELEDCIQNTDYSPETAAESALIVEALNDFLEALSHEHRWMFVRRYWYLSSIEDIAQECGRNTGNVKTILFRTRQKLKLKFEKEGIVV